MTVRSQVLQGETFNSLRFCCLPNCLSPERNYVRVEALPIVSVRQSNAAAMAAPSSWLKDGTEPVCRRTLDYSTVRRAAAVPVVGGGWVGELLFFLSPLSAQSPSKPCNLPLLPGSWVSCFINREQQREQVSLTRLFVEQQGRLFVLFSAGR